MAYWPLIVSGLCACVLGPPLLTIAGSAIIGFILALVDLQRVLLEEHRRVTYRVYVLDSSWRITRAVVTQQFTRANHRVEQWRDHAATMRYAAFTCWPLKYPVWLIIIALLLAARVHYVLAAMIVGLFVSVYLLVLLALAIVTFSSLATLATFSLLADLSARVNHRACVCPDCYLPTYFPLFLCPGCKTAHPRLQPNLQGVLFHCCAHCERRLPTLDPLGRRRLERVCPRCQSPFPAALGTVASIHIALVGAVAPDHTCGATALAAVGPGAVIVPLTTALAAVAPRLSLMLLLRSPRALLYLYDSTGKDFMSSEHVSHQSYYKHINGLIFFIDPFAIPAFYQHFQARVEQRFPDQRPGEPPIERLYARMMRALEISTGLRPGQPYHQSIAVVISFAALPSLASSSGGTASRALEQQYPSVRSGEEAQHQLVRRFLCHYDLENMVRDLEAHFRRVRYFATSGPPPEALTEPPHVGIAGVGSEPGAHEALAWLLSTLSV